MAEHKTKHLYGSAKVRVEPVCDLLLQYGETIASDESTAPLFKFSKKFGLVLKEFKQRSGTERLTSSKYRQAVETNVIFLIL